MGQQTTAHHNSDDRKVTHFQVFLHTTLDDIIHTIQLDLLPDDDPAAARSKHRLIVHRPFILGACLLDGYSVVVLIN